MLVVMLLNQHRIRHPKPSDHVLHVLSDLSGMLLKGGLRFYSEAPHAQFGEGARPHLCMYEWNRPTSAHRRLSSTQAVWGKLNVAGLTLALDKKT